MTPMEDDRVGSGTGRASGYGAFRPSQPYRELLSKDCPAEGTALGRPQALRPEGSGCLQEVTWAGKQAEADAEGTGSVLWGHVRSTPPGLPRRHFVSL